VLAFSDGAPAGSTRSPGSHCRPPCTRSSGEALNRPRAKLGLDLSTWMVIVFVTATAFLVGFRLLAILSFPALVGSAWLIVRKHPKMFQLWGLSLSQRSYYDPRKY
jgi:type IV secretory pathway VirB3-like protein